MTLKTNEIKKIRRLRKAGLMIQEIRKRTGYSQTTICQYTRDILTYRERLLKEISKKTQSRGGER
jgi:hypothetical protein